MGGAEMSKLLSVNKEYAEWLKSLSQRFRQSQIKAAVKVNSELLKFYWSLGQDIVERDFENTYGSEFFKNLSLDLKEEFPETKGFSPTNLGYIKRFYMLYFNAMKISPQVEGKSPQISNLSNYPQVGGNSEPLIFSVPWGHHKLLIDKFLKAPEKVMFYVQKTVENNWSRTVLDWQIDSNLYERQGKAISNFKRTLPTPQSDLAQQITKDPYVIDIMGVRQEMQERELEEHLDSHISKYLLELGKGFTYYGHQVHLRVGNEDFYIDQLFYHVRLHCYVVIELKATAFKPEHIGQLNFYVTAVNKLMCTEHDNPTIGLLICKDKNDVVAEYTLQGVDSPIGVSSVEIFDKLTEDFKSALPSIEDIENELRDKKQKEDEV
jgi:predicted nuclease of restriction endonuclease-like (RecB) superfamily